MMGNHAIEAAFASRDRDALLREVGPLFETLRTDHRITHLYFNSPDLVNVLRLHSPGEFGDLINRATTTKARDQGKAVHGLELGPLGTLTLRLVTPWRRSDGILGYLEIGEEIEYLVDEIRDSLSVDLFVLVDKRFLLPQQWQHGLTLLKRQGSWDRFGSQVMVAQTTGLPSALNDSVLASLSIGGTEVFEDGSRALHLAMLPLEDASGRRIGDLVVMRDITALQKTFQRSVMAVTFLSLLAGAGVLGLFYFALDRVERDYQRQHELEHQLLRLGTEHQRILQIEKLSALGTMVGEIAHQLNNPLVGVVNLAQLAAREADDDPARTRELLKEIRRAGEDCHTFIQSMLRFSKVSSFESKPTTMAQVIEETVLLFRQTESRQLPVETRLPEQAVILTVDPILIRHALFNLLVNAAQATVGEGAIVIALDRGVSSDSGAPGWVLSVTDHGKGLAPDIMDKIFLPFFTTRSDGTGLGLPVVQHVALMHGGYVSASNQPGGGTQFAVWLPEENKLAEKNQSNQLEHGA
jgi:signal transduction histidine kinase